jgi:hypothetical protein
MVECQEFDMGAGIHGFVIRDMSPWISGQNGQGTL